MLLVLSLGACLHLHVPRHIPYRSTIIKVSCHNHVDPRLTAAIIKEESGYHRYAMKIEKNGDVSRGLMQVEYRTARSLGLRRKPSWLYSPWLNIFYGTKYLHLLMLKYKNLGDVISAYNAGHPLFNAMHGRYVNRRYVLSVTHFYKAYSGLKIEDPEAYTRLVNGKIANFKRIRRYYGILVDYQRNEFQ